MKQIFEIYDTLRSFGFSERLARYICCQAAHETGDFTSPIYRINNNLFGMKVPKLRETTALYEKNGHAVYSTTKESVKDYYLYFKAQGLPLDFNSPDLFVETLAQRNYFEANIEDYKKGLKYFLKKYFNGVE